MSRHIRGNKMFHQICLTIFYNQNGKIAKIEITLPVETNANVMYDLPTGFSRDNCVIIGGHVVNKNNGVSYNLLNMSNDIKLEYPGRISYTATDVFNGQKCTIVLCKIQ